MDHQIDLLAGGRIRAPGGVGTSLDGVADGLLCVRWASTRERGRPARILLQTACPRPLPCKFTGCSSIVPVFAGTPALPGSGGTPALPGGIPSSFPTHGRPLWIFRQPLSGPSSSFVDKSFSLWQSRYFPDCRTLLRISSRLVLAVSRVGSRARARSRLRIASSVRSRKCRVAPMSA